MRESDYRENVGIMLIDDNHQILVGEAYHYPGEWQMPQGGVEANESAEQALWRELAEETGICQHQTTLLGRYPGWLYYTLRLPLAHNGSVFLGQKQTWFLLSYNGPIPDINRVPEKEFLQFDRTSPEWLLERTPAVKLPTYTTIFDYFLSPR